MQVSIVGLVLPLVISFAKRFVVLEGVVTGLLTLAVCFVIALGFELSENSSEWNAETLVQKLLLVYGAAQLVYKGVMKPTGIDAKIESK